MPNRLMITIVGFALVIGSCRPEELSRATSPEAQASTARKREIRPSTATSAPASKTVSAPPAGSRHLSLASLVAAAPPDAIGYLRERFWQPVVFEVLETGSIDPHRSSWVNWKIRVQKTGSGGPRFEDVFPVEFVDLPTGTIVNLQAMYPQNPEQPTGVVGRTFLGHLSMNISFPENPPRYLTDSRLRALDEGLRFKPDEVPVRLGGVVEIPAGHEVNLTPEIWRFDASRAGSIGSPEANGWPRRCFACHDWNSKTIDRCPALRTSGQRAPKENTP